MKKDVLQYEMTNSGGIGVYCGTYRKYNEGSLYGMWIDIELCDDADEFFEVCRKLHDDERDPELMFQDFQGFPSCWYSECMGEETINKIIEYAQMSDSDKEMLEDYAEINGGDIDDYDLERVRDKCVASGFDTLQEWSDLKADEMIDDYESMCEHDYFLKAAMPIVDDMRRYFNYDSYYRDIKDNYSIGSNGYIFMD